jgi:DNA-binding transcriptional regulator YiaG
MKKVIGEWVIDINMNKLQETVFRALIYKPVPLTGDELNFMRVYLNMTMAEFGKALGVTHVSVVNWENEKRNISPPMEVCIRFYCLQHIRAKDREFRKLYDEVNLAKLSKQKETKIHSLKIDFAEDFKIAL